jgi:hypothetical protein
MKYLIAGLIIPTIPILLTAVFVIGALCCGVANLLEWKKQFSPEYTAARQRSLLHDARAFQR